MQPHFYGVEDNVLWQSSLKCVLNLLTFVLKPWLHFQQYTVLVLEEGEVNMVGALLS